jgi:hypothetical protein
LGLFYSSGLKEHNDRNSVDPNSVDHNLVATNLVDPVVVEPNILVKNLLYFIALVQSELSQFRTATSWMCNCSIQGHSRAVKVNNVVVSQQTYHCGQT